MHLLPASATETLVQAQWLVRADAVEGRVIALVVGTLWGGSIVLGYAYDFLLAALLF